MRRPDGSLQKRFDAFDNAVPAELVLAADPSPSPRLAERPALSADGDGGGEDATTGGFTTGDAALFLGRSHFGATAAMSAQSGRARRRFPHRPAAPCTGVGCRILQGVQGGQYEHVEARWRAQSGLSPRALSQLTGPLWIAPTKDAGRHDRVDLGLNLKSAAKGLCVADYSRPGKDGSGWEFVAPIRLLQDYKKHHGWVFHALMADADNGFERLGAGRRARARSRSRASPRAQGVQSLDQGDPRRARPLVSNVRTRGGVRGGGEGAPHATLGGRRLSPPRTPPTDRPSWRRCPRCC